MTFTGKLINPQIFSDDSGPVCFDQTFVIVDEDGNEVLRKYANFPYSIPDANVQKWVIDSVQNFATWSEVEQEPQQTVQWDWPEGVE